MPIYTVRGPDGKTYKIEGPQGATAEQLGEVISSKQGKPDTTMAQDVLQGAGNLLAGGLRGAGSIGATLIRPFESATENDARRKSMDSALQSLGAEPDSWMYQGGKLGGEVLGTAGAGGVIAKPLSMIAPRLAQAVASSGFTAGGAGLGTRAAGGAIAGGTQSAMVGDNAGVGAAIGGALPGVTKLAGVTGSAVGRGIMSMLTPQQQAMAAEVAKMTGKSLNEVLQAVEKQGPSILSIKPTVPQILQDDAVSQLQRSAINAGDKSIMARQAAQNAERMVGFERVAPVFGTVNEAADNAGALIGNYGNSARANKAAEVRNMFDAVDPFGDTAIEIPIAAMQSSKGKYLGAGTFGKGNAPTTALQVAEDVGTELLPAVAPMSQRAAGKSQSLEQAVRSAGGIRGGSGELRDLGIKQSGTTGLVNNKSGKPADLLAEDMYQRGFIPDNDPATLFDYLRNGNGRKVFANDATEGGFQGVFERSMGDAPEALRVMKPVPFQTVQNFRGSLNEAWKDASMRGRNQEAAALKSMIADIDNKVAKVAGGRGEAGESFPPDIVETWKEALAAHAEKKARFDTGPQAQMFRKGGDGMALIQGAEIPGKFFSGRASQIEDAQAFKRLTQSNPTLAKALKSYAITDAAQQTTKDGMMSANKLSKWANSRSGALKETMSEQDMALINEIVRGVKQADSAATGGMAAGSNTAQNAEAAARFLGNGMLDSKLFDIASTKLPLGGFGLNALRKSTSAGKAETVGGLLSDPEVFSQELKKFMRRQQAMDFRGLLNDPRAALVGQAGYRAAPLLMGD